MNVRPNGGSDNAKIVCTLGPSSMDRGTVERLADAGMDVARLHASHGSTAQRRELIQTVRDVEGSVGRPLGVLLVIAGPEVRAVASDEGQTLQPGDSVEFT